MTTAIRLPPPSIQAARLSRDAIAWAYRLLLGREPESEAVYEHYGKLTDWNELKLILWASAEFKGMIARQSDHRWVIAPFAQGRLKAWIDLADHYVSSGMLFDRFEPATTSLILGQLKPGDVFYDIGANLGWYTLQAASIVGPSGCVYAFEPRPDIAARLKQNVILNGFGGIVQVHEFALGAANGRASLIEVPDEFNPGHSFLGTPFGKEALLAEVDVRALDDLLLRSPTLVKIDVEGAEGLVWEGAKQILSSTHPIVVCEIFPPFLKRVSGLSAAEFLSRCDELGYSAVAVSNLAHPDAPVPNPDEFSQPVEFVLTQSSHVLAPSAETHATLCQSFFGFSMQLPPPIEPEIFRGYLLEDMRRLELLRGTTESYPKGLVDWFGVRIDAEYAPWLSDRCGEVLATPPLPTDTFLSEGIEYAGLALALEHATDDSFCSLELGAGWGPWTTLAAVCARRYGITRISSNAVEADAGRFAQMRRHLALNNVIPLGIANEGSHGDITFALKNAAIWWENTTLYWPVAVESDSGRSVAKHDGHGTDYRGRQMNMIPVEAIGLPSLLAGYKRVDFLHIDIQGAEAEVVPKSIEAIEKLVRVMFIGTHSRKIEGDLLEFLFLRGWRLLREQPCTFDPMRKAPTFQGLTQRDGGQVWLSPLMVAE